EVLMLTYLILIIWLIAPGLLRALGFLLTWSPPATWAAVLEDWVERSNPYLLAFAPYGRPATLGLGTYLGFLAGCLVVATALTGLATARIRGVISSQVGRPAAGHRRSRLLHVFSPRRLPGPSLDGNPVAWREWHRTRPSLMMRIVWGLYSALGLLCIGLAASSWSWGGPPGAGVCYLIMMQVAVGLLLLSVAAVTSLAEGQGRRRAVWRRRGCAAASTSCSRPRSPPARSWSASGRAASGGSCTSRSGRPRWSSSRPSRKGTGGPTWPCWAWCLPTARRSPAWA